MELPQATPVLINMLSVTNSNGPTFNTRSQTHQCLSPDTSTSQTDITSEVSEVTNPTLKSLTADRLEAENLPLLQKNIQMLIKWKSTLA